ncbi:MAG: 2,3,4,5-tetrahydropyridine-2,6-dicarboxylate N-succinyltransferase [Candidatus Bostrichicola ureolyticus]|nr:MAG: 2,3,4,5-tetrahydropyridine-2,6-dicarboxylate N-succinyltransferase [Candidatus Bostrichicola ureolyticus]
MDKYKTTIEKVWNYKQNWKTTEIKNIIFDVIKQLDNGTLRIATYDKNDKKWIINEWIKKTILMYFSIKEMELIEVGPFEFYDKIPLKNSYDEKKVRVVPHAIARYGSYISPGSVLMPSYVNIGAYIGTNSMIDTWSTVGSCAQIGSNVHISGGVGIGGVLEPLQSAPVIIEDNVFIGSRCILVEGVYIEEEAVLGANVVLTASTKIIDVTGNNPIEIKGRVPKRSVVIPGSYSKEYPAGRYNVQCALIIGKRKESTNKKTSLNEVLREHNII